MARTPPTRITVGVATYRITTDPDDWMRIEHETQLKGYYGHTKHENTTIYLNPDLPTSVLRLSLWHEVMHALAETCMGAPKFGNLGKGREVREETIIRAWEHPTLAVLRDNPQLVAFLTGDETE